MSKKWRVEMRVFRFHCQGPWIGCANAIRGLHTEYDTEEAAREAEAVAKRNWKVQRGVWQVRVVPPTEEPAPLASPLKIADVVRQTVQKRVEAEQAATDGELLTALKAFREGGKSA